MIPLRASFWICLGEFEAIARKVSLLECSFSFLLLYIYIYIYGEFTLLERVGVLLCLDVKILGGCTLKVVYKHRSPIQVFIFFHMRWLNDFHDFHPWWRWACSMVQSLNNRSWWKLWALVNVYFQRWPHSFPNVISFKSIAINVYNSPSWQAENLNHLLEITKF